MIAEVPIVCKTTVVTPRHLPDLVVPLISAPVV
jgi:hypothetical protein